MSFDRKHNLGYATIPDGEPIVARVELRSGNKTEKSCFYNKSHDRLYTRRFSLIKDLKAKNQ